MTTRWQGCASAVLVIVFVVSNRVATARNQTVEQKIRDDPDLSEFYSLLENSAIANNTLQYRQVTLFAPTNRAFQKYKGSKDDLILYHMTNLAKPLDQLDGSVSSELEGNPPIWITRIKGRYRDDLYANNAQILQDRSNYIQMNHQQKQQVLHVIDKVLVPVRSANKDTTQIYNPDAFHFLNQSENLDVGDHRLRSFRQRVYQNNKGNVFLSEGKHTFFIPVDEGFKPTPRPEKIDQKVIDGHVIPNHALFTDATPKDKDYETLAFGDNVRVTISFSTQSNGKASSYYVKSNTIVGDPNHTEGVVLAEIVKANIPVRNGVVHLINRPLMVVDTTVKQFLESFKSIFDQEDGPLHEFYNKIQDEGGEFMQQITKLRDLTLFAPSNLAWTTANIVNVHNRDKLREILNLHLVYERLTVEKIRDENVNQVQTAAERRKLYFNVIKHGHNVTLTVEGGGVNATVIEPNIAATNGFVHIIDRVLGLPYTSVKEKLQSDPMLNNTYHLGQQGNFNEELGDSTKRFTYFVPRDYAWHKAEIHFPSAHKKLFMKDYGYHVRQILERHLVVSDQPYTMADLKRLANDTVTLPTVRDHLKLRIKESDKSYYVEWQGEWIHVFRPDVECTNGIIHVIDSVFLKESDVRVTRSPSVPLMATHVTIILSVAMLFSVKWLLL
ncbi:fasciclin-1 isoform X2 [Zootermopsis nevadensis]|uniref:fasciclin-1 isoform X2 n=1 Tax=Zootermopsis nevadensis TaxID=136037 RepID=UPI000B8ECF01|nr:fasciclin-1 isoform X2 [Zootermopsis nevadensis]